MERVGLDNECKILEQIINDLKTGKAKYEIENDKYSIAEAIDYLQGFLNELCELNNQIVMQGNTPELLEMVHKKYTEIWLFGVYFSINDLPVVVGGLLCYPNNIQTNSGLSIQTANRCLSITLKNN